MAARRITTKVEKRKGFTVRTTGVNPGKTKKTGVIPKGHMNVKGKRVQVGPGTGRNSRSGGHGA